MKPEANCANRERHRVLLGLLAICAVYLVFLGPRDWIPHDDGAMAHAAERVLAGEIPHRDFNEPYTGGLTFLHAAAFRLFGVELVSLRWMLLLFSLGFVAALFRVASYAAPPTVAAAVTLVAFVWSLPNYFVPLPSWYNLFFSTFGILALFRYIEDPRGRWLVITGAMGALSVLCKVVGLYYFAAVYLALIYFEASGVRRSDGAERNAWGFVGLCAVGLSVFLLMVVVLVSNRLSALSTLLFIVPCCAVAGLALFRAVGSRDGSALGLLANIGLVTGSAVVVLAGYLTVHLRTSSLDAFWNGTVSVVLRRLDYTGGPLPGIETVMASLPFAALFFSGIFVKRIREPLAFTATLVTAGFVFLAFGGKDSVYQGAWYAVRPLVPILVLAAVTLLSDDVDRRQGARLYVLAAMASLLSLVQFPFSGGIYFCYVAPIVVVLAMHVVHATPTPPVRTLALTGAMFTAFAVLWMHTGSTYMLGYGYHRAHSNVRLALPRGGIRVRERDALFYRELVDRIADRTASDAYIYVSPDMPEVYFLSQRRNPTRTLFDSTDSDYLEPETRNARVMRELEAHDVAFAVLGPRSEFSRPASPLLQAYLAERLPHHEMLAGVLLRWR